MQLRQPLFDALNRVSFGGEQGVRSWGSFALSAKMFPEFLLGQQVVQVTIIYLATCLWSCLRP
jgi:hypothetical protein